MSDESKPDPLCFNCEIVPKYESMMVKHTGKLDGKVPAVRTTCDMCGGVYLVIEEVAPKLTSLEAGLKFQAIKHEVKEDGRKSKKKGKAKK